MMLVRGLGRDPTVSAGHRHHGVAVWAFAVLLALAGTTAPMASAATGIATETRVGAIDHPAPVSVGSEAPESSTGIGVGTVGFEACVAAAATTTGGSTPEQGYDGTVAQRVDVVTETPFDRARVLRSSVEVVSGAERNRGALSDADARFATNSAPSPLTDIPADAQIRVLKPDPNGGAQYGVEHKWVNADGQTVRFRVHGPDGNAPPGTNAATGETYRVQVGGRYMDADGNLHPRGVHNPRSPNYDPDAANATHIPWQGLSWPN